MHTHIDAHRSKAKEHGARCIDARLKGTRPKKCFNHLPPPAGAGVTGSGNSVSRILLVESCTRCSLQRGATQRRNFTAVVFCAAR